jgi:hypothetical protein
VHNRKLYDYSQNLVYKFILKLYVWTWRPFNLLAGLFEKKKKKKDVSIKDTRTAEAITFVNSFHIFACCRDLLLLSRWNLGLKGVEFNQIQVDPHTSESLKKKKKKKLSVQNFPDWKVAPSWIWFTFLFSTKLLGDWGTAVYINTFAHQSNTQFSGILS